VYLGVFTEATAFRIAKFDEVDFCSQSLGAVLASIVAIPFVSAAKLPDNAFDQAMVVAIAFLVLLRLPQNFGRTIEEAGPQTKAARNLRSGNGTS
jgi:hypothetical protein